MVCVVFIQEECVVEAYLMRVLLSPALSIKIGRRSETREPTSRGPTSEAWFSTRARSTCGVNNFLVEALSMLVEKSEYIGENGWQV